MTTASHVDAVKLPGKEGPATQEYSLSIGIKSLLRQGLLSLCGTLLLFQTGRAEHRSISFPAKAVMVDYSVTLSQSALAKASQIGVDARVANLYQSARLGKRRKLAGDLEIGLSAGLRLGALPSSCRRVRRCRIFSAAEACVRCAVARVRTERSRKFRLRLSVEQCDRDFELQAGVSLRKYLTDISDSNNRSRLSVRRNCTSVPTPAPTPPASCTSSSIVTGQIVEVASLSEFTAAIEEANLNGNRTILIADGTYQLEQGFWISGNNITIRSRSGRRDGVILRGAGMQGGVSHIFSIAGNDVSIADMTIGAVSNHAVQVNGELGVSRVLLHNLRIIDTGEQMVKGSYDTARPDNGAIAGVVQCCWFEYTAGIGPQYYIGGVDVHAGRDWIVRDNVFLSIRSPESSLAEHAIHFWSASQGTTVERNIIINCDRGIGFGLGERGHSGGIIRNNIIYHDESLGDVGIGLETAESVSVYHNTIYFSHDYPNAIEYRFNTTTAHIANNLTNRAIAGRDGGNATLVDNVTTAEPAWFQDPASGNLHLAAGEIVEVDNQGGYISAASEDIDREARSPAGVDIGADER